MRWTAKRKAEAILDLLKGVYTLQEFCRRNDLKQSEVEQWMETFQIGGTRSLKINSVDERALREAEIKELRAKIGELVLDNEILKKAKEIAARGKDGDETDL
jgi:transposase-like protein